MAVNVWLYTPAPEQVWSEGPNNVTVIEPVPSRLTPPPRVALSFRVSPTVPEDGCGARLNSSYAYLTTTVSSSQALEADLLLPSPVNLAVQRSVPATMA